MNEEPFKIGDKVWLKSLPPYLKTAEPMPMLRPCDLLEIGAEGIILDRRPGEYWGVRFEKGAFLMESQYLELVSQKNEAENSEMSASENPQIEN
jgi:hypothetical protein